MDWVTLHENNYPHYPIPKHLQLPHSDAPGTLPFVSCAWRPTRLWGMSQVPSLTCVSPPSSSRTTPLGSLSLPHSTIRRVTWSRGWSELDEACGDCGWLWMLLIWEVGGIYDFFLLFFPIFSLSFLFPFCVREWCWGLWMFVNWQEVDFESLLLIDCFYIFLLSWSVTMFLKWAGCYVFIIIIDSLLWNLLMFCPFGCYVYSNVWYFMKVKENCELCS